MKISSFFCFRIAAKNSFPFQRFSLKRRAVIHKISYQKIKNENDNCPGKKEATSIAAMLASATFYRRRLRKSAIKRRAHDKDGGHFV
jgi:hypothetical protein